MLLFYYQRIGELEGEGNMGNKDKREKFLMLHSPTFFQNKTGLSLSTCAWNASTTYLYS